MLEGKNLRKAFRRTVAVQDVSLRVGRGEVVGLLGPNGAGKTTTFEMMAGFLSPDRGTVRLAEASITGLPVYRRARLGISYLPQEIALFQQLNVEDNLYVILESFFGDRRAMREKCEKLLRRMSLWEMRKTVAGNLSGGEKRRLEIARSLINRPKYFLLDEPFSGIDPKTVSEIQGIVKTLKQEGIGVLLTDHNVRDTLKITDRAYLIHGGRILVEGTPGEILEHPDSRKVYFGEDFEL